MNNFLHELENAVINENHKVTKEEAIQLYETEQASELFGAADRIRKSCCTNSSSEIGRAHV